MDKTPLFSGRAKELADLGRFLNKKSSSLIFVRGRSRVGKSRLIEEPSQKTIKTRQRKRVAISAHALTKKRKK